MKASKLSLDLIQVYSVCLVYIIPSEIQRETEMSLRYLESTYCRDSNLRVWGGKVFNGL